MNRPDLEARLASLLAMHRKSVETEIAALAIREGSAEGIRADARHNAALDVFLEAKHALLDSLAPPAKPGIGRIDALELERIRQGLGALLVGPGGGNKILRDMERLLHEVVILRDELAKSRGQ